MVLIPHMTGPAVNFGVLSEQLESRFGMIKLIDACPAFGQVAFFAGLIGVPCRCNFTLVNIVVTINTTLADVAELPFLSSVR